MVLLLTKPYSAFIKKKSHLENKTMSQNIPLWQEDLEQFPTAMFIEEGLKLFCLENKSEKKREVDTKIVHMPEKKLDIQNEIKIKGEEEKKIEEFVNIQQNEESFELKFKDWDLY